MTGQGAVKAWAMCSWRTSCTSDRGLTCDFHSVITQVALRMQLCHLLRAGGSAVAAESDFHGGRSVIFMPLLFTPVVL